eukprot:scaffold286173_cov29-Tisochrysis_lutea.AAC.1
MQAERRKQSTLSPAGCAVGGEAAKSPEAAVMTTWYGLRVAGHSGCCSAAAAASRLSCSCLRACGGMYSSEGAARAPRAP